MRLSASRSISNKPSAAPYRGIEFRAPWLLFWAALLVRLVYMTLAHTYRFSALEDHFHFGWESGRIARALASGYGYADPFVGHTGPTAWLPPLFPLLLAAVFKVFGIYTAFSAWIVLAIDCLFSAITALAVYEIAARCFNRKVALWSGWIWALHPAAMQYAVRWVWETTLTTMLFALALVLALRMRGVGEAGSDQYRLQTVGAWLGFGCLWGLIALSNSTLLLFLPVCGVWILLGASKPDHALNKAILSLLVFLVLIAPWTIRNWKVFHAFIPMRSNFGAELWTGNNPSATGIALGAAMEPIWQDPRMVSYRALGEIAYSKRLGERAKSYIRSHPGHFIRLSVKRFYFFWVNTPHPVDNKPFSEAARELNYCFISLAGCMGLALAWKNKTPAAGLFACAFALLPLTYYFVSVQARFRHPLEPLLDVLGVYLFQSAILHRKTGSSAVPEKAAHSH